MIYSTLTKSQYLTQIVRAKAVLPRTTPERGAQ